MGQRSSPQNMYPWSTPCWSRAFRGLGNTLGIYTLMVLQFALITFSHRTRFTGIRQDSRSSHTVVGIDVRPCEKQRNCSMVKSTSRPTDDAIRDGFFQIKTATSPMTSAISRASYLYTPSRAFDLFRLDLSSGLMICSPMYINQFVEAGSRYSPRYSNGHFAILRQESLRLTTKVIILSQQQPETVD